jgi:hypothetical protein
MTALDDRAEALADHLHSASVAAAQLADARDEARTGAPAAGQCTPDGCDAHGPATPGHPTSTAAGARTGEQ